MPFLMVVELSTKESGKQAEFQMIRCRKMRQPMGKERAKEALYVLLRVARVAGLGEIMVVLMMAAVATA